MPRFNARQAFLNHPQKVISQEYLQLKEEKESRQRRWWQFWENGTRNANSPPQDPASNNPASPRQEGQVVVQSSQEGGECGEQRKVEENKPARPPLTILCDSSAESTNVNLPLTKATDYKSIWVDIHNPGYNIRLDPNNPEPFLRA
ncbi:hypothetical protein PEX2_020340 [Penicillium expansum]|uniref:Uncharacterized protein n=1 Tax=Penicillium expansum TaxID=27334 RepID=A0A0A2JZH6_PENEN|nr:hypothetical protein PEX2_020340 [Penicillium expansum]KGO57590.1 hypothetical protein PEX2_020340 [Penicillium expansum]